MVGLSMASHLVNLISSLVFVDRIFDVSSVDRVSDVAVDDLLPVATSLCDLFE